MTEADVVVVGGGSAGSTAAVEAQQRLPRGRVVLLEKAHIKRSGAIAIGMDGLNNAIIPGHATPEQYVKEITVANDGIVNQRAVYEYARNSFAMIQELDSWGVKFQKTRSGDFDVKKVHHNGSYVLPMPEGYDLKKILTRMVKRAGVKVVNRVMATRILVTDGHVAGVIGFDTREGHIEIIKARAVILCCGASGRLGLPASGYLHGTYENPSNAGDGYSMAYHAGAELSGIECFQVNPLIKDYNGPACAYVTGPLGGHTVNAKGHRFIESDYWSGQMMLEFYRELHSANGPVYLKLTHLAPETITEVERVLHQTERPSRGRFHEGRGHSYASDLVEMHISEIGLCSGHSASGVWVNEKGETTVPGLYAAGDMACVPLAPARSGAHTRNRDPSTSMPAGCSPPARPRERARTAAAQQTQRSAARRPPGQRDPNQRAAVRRFLQASRASRMRPPARSCARGSAGTVESPSAPANLHTGGQ
ncbi:fumarate reductase/succinate dehydrogenase flavoprotein subunit [Sorangium sp. wiwo2]|uniref:Fumarate reductase/succinate dehydrogenase flavoprotein subunit n=1 Tax=Sorangium atrum TaxID=2995308 RepID=A0ABT5CGG5_9BACT|nr:fumarate reductase/succinate dehydrogenase flavoprotein subunit [Sorangium aterium]MDC0685520.1 fumarate reductase/succinate dehydrogenase flavoprotein subunit [Sorangium aterium]